MTKKKEDELLSSNYDGIQEYDNDLPRWWTALFIITILYSVFYVFNYHISDSPSSEEELKVEMARISELKAAAPAQVVSDEVLLSYVKNPERVSNGKAVYDGKCAACHGFKGEGIVGPNLTDDYWIHGGKISEIHKIIEIGVPEKGMVPWKGLLSNDEIDNVSAYIYSIHATNPSNPKAPQGELVPR